ncbi:MAG: glycosyltransferase family 39 protein, partial [Nitrospirota bacterium]|nr:glycosyltransferase family 39 protein [Nitrospirota bacterium]
RETAFDDDWVYALMVQHLLQTNSYQLHEWATANLPFQTYWGGLFAHVFGYSFTSLRISTLVLVFFGLSAFYFLARECGLNDTQAGLTMVALLASPLFLLYSFTFQTDVPLLMCLIIALFFYTRAIKKHSYPLMVSASVAASAAILTRQFGLAIPAGVFLLWALSKERRKQAPLFAMGLILPVVAGLCQLYLATLAPNTMQWRNLHDQALYFSNISSLLLNIVFRPSIILQYLALFTLPLVCVALVAVTCTIIRADSLDSKCTKGDKHYLFLLVILTLYILSGILALHIANHWPRLMPSIPWDFTFLFQLGDLSRVTVTLITALGAILYAFIIVARFRDDHIEAGIRKSERLVDYVFVFLLAEVALYSTLADRYIVVLLPCVLIMVGRYIGGWLDRFSMAVGIACVTMLIVSALWTRERLEREEAGWKGAESLLAARVQPSEVFGFDPWNFYRGATHDYLAEVGEARIESFKDFWSRWYPERRKRARFLIVDSPVAPKGEEWKVVARIPYRGMFLGEERVYVIKRES